MSRLQACSCLWNSYLQSPSNGSSLNKCQHMNLLTDKTGEHFTSRPISISAGCQQSAECLSSCLLLLGVNSKKSCYFQQNIWSDPSICNWVTLSRWKSKNKPSENERVKMGLLYTANEESKWFLKKGGIGFYAGSPYILMSKTTLGVCSFLM